MSIFEGLKKIALLLTGSDIDTEDLKELIIRDLQRNYPNLSEEEKVRIINEFFEGFKKADMKTASLDQKHRLRNPRNFGSNMKFLVDSFESKSELPLYSASNLMDLVKILKNTVYYEFLQKKINNWLEANKSKKLEGNQANNLQLVGARV